MSLRWLPLLNLHKCWRRIGRRNLLSDAYQCSSEWESRRISPTLKEIDIYELLNKMVVRMNAGHTPSAVDIDVAANCINHEDQLKEFNDLFWKFRHSMNSGHLLESTSHAIIRFCLKLDLEDLLMKFLNDPINYGVFPDPYAANILMDHFLKKGNHRDAAKVAFFLMLQEEFDIESSRYFMILSCLRWLSDPKPVDEAKPVEDTDSDEIIFRFPYLKNPYFDDHFDLTDMQQLAGKTLMWTTDSMSLKDQDEKQLMQNCKLLGVALRRSIPEALATLNEFLANENLHLHSEVAKRLEEAFQTIPVTNESTEDKKAPDVPKKIDVEVGKNIAKIQDAVKRLRSKGRIINDDLTETFSKKMEKLLPAFEKQDIVQIKALIFKWNAARERRVDNQVQIYMKKERLKMVEKQIEEMKYEQDLLFFFENREKVWEQQLPAKLFVKEKEIKATTDVPADEDYVIPEVKRRNVSKKGPMSK